MKREGKIYLLYTIVTKNVSGHRYVTVLRYSTSNYDKWMKEPYSRFSKFISRLTISTNRTHIYHFWNNILLRTLLYEKNIEIQKISISQILFTPPWKGIKNEPYSHIYDSNQTMTFTHDCTLSLSLSPSPFLIYSRVLLLSVWHEKCEMENERMIRLSIESIYI